ncbi:MAG: acetolactate synthase small subunit [Desulfomicrobium sp.]|jgi:acetolactate synthase-1/3 small subunit|nr:acetolactate synthase small subunit [Desulfomicrobium sp.]NLV96458.1 acetolactate synthase small subunit [Desulfovibrionales bacterium]
MRHTISFLLQNKPGVLAHVATIFERYGINIRSISCGETEQEDISRMIICVEVGFDEIQAVTRELEGQDFVLGLEDLSGQELIDRELVMIKVHITKATVSQILQIFEVFQANVIDMGNETISAELAAPASKVAGLIRILASHGIVSLSRTGLIALTRGDL